MHTGKSLLYYFPLQSWHTSKSWICLCFIKCVFKNFVIFMAFFFPCGVNFRVFSMLTVYMHIVGFLGVAPSTALPAHAQEALWRHLSLFHAWHLLSFISCMFFCNLYSLIPGLGCVSVGSFFKSDILKSHFWNQPNLFAPHHYPHYQSPTQTAVLLVLVHLFLNSIYINSLHHWVQLWLDIWHLFRSHQNTYEWLTYEIVCHSNQNVFVFSGRH